MVMRNVRPGYGAVGAYQRSGRPFATGSAGNTLDANSIHRIKFPYITKNVVVINRASSKGIRVLFHSGTLPGGSTVNADVITNGLHYITLDTKKDSLSMDIAVADLYLQGTAADCAYEVFAELTSIPRGDMPELTGSGVSSHQDDFFELIKA